MNSQLLNIETVNDEGRVGTCTHANFTTKTTYHMVSSTQRSTGISSTPQPASSPGKWRLQPGHGRRLLPNIERRSATKTSATTRKCRVVTHDKRMCVGDQAELANATTRQVVTELTGTVLLSSSSTTFAIILDT
jgi:hypothetical protein